MRLRPPRSRTDHRAVRVVALFVCGLVLALAGAPGDVLVGNGAPAARAAGGDPTPVFHDAAGLSVVSVERARDQDIHTPDEEWDGSLLSRTWTVRVHTSEIALAALPSVPLTITLPEDYFRPGNRRHYPMVLALHGAKDSASGWAATGAGGDIERLTKGRDVIVVTPEGGRAGWYTDWADQRPGVQHWETFHIDQVLPFIDANLRTWAERAGRAVVGFSMGATGAMGYAVRHPQLFAHVGAYSGPMDIDHFVGRLTIQASVVISGMGPTSGPFGPLLTGTDFAARDPMTHAEALRGMDVVLDHGRRSVRDLGDATFDQVAIEALVAENMTRFSRRLDALGIAHTHHDRGRSWRLPGQPWCAGTHTWNCARQAAQVDVARMMRVLRPAG